MVLEKQQIAESILCANHDGCGGNGDEVTVMVMIMTLMKKADILATEGKV